jgi:hypothetical protein
MLNKANETENGPAAASSAEKGVSFFYDDVMQGVFSIFSSFLLLAAL